MMITIGTMPVGDLLAYGGYFTLIDKNNPANGTGVLAKIVIWCKFAAHVKIGTFFANSSTSYTCRAAHSIGWIAAETITTVNVAIPVVAGDFLGGYYDVNGAINMKSSGPGVGVMANAGGDSCNTGVRSDGCWLFVPGPISCYGYSAPLPSGHPPIVIARSIPCLSIQS